MDSLSNFFGPLAMVRPRNDTDVSALLAEALTELRSVNRQLASVLSGAPPSQPIKA